MLGLAASFVIASSSTSHSQGAPSVPNVANAAVNRAWARIEPSIVIVQQNGAPRGTATLIDGRGWFLAQQSVVQGGSRFEGKFFNGQSVQLILVKNDNTTQLALLKTDQAVSSRPSVSIYRPDSDDVSPRRSVALLAVLASGAIPAELVTTKHLGVQNKSGSVITFSEIQFESAPSSVGGAPVFTYDGRLVGVLEATLAAKPADFAPKALASPISDAGGLAQRSFGPEGMIVAYSPSPDILARVINGFLSPSHEVQRPAIGLYCLANAGHGALVDSVVIGSPAVQAGIRRMDVITAINETPIHSQIEFGRAMLQQSVGSVISVTLLRGNESKVFRVRVGM